MAIIPSRVSLHQFFRGKTGGMVVCFVFLSGRMLEDFSVYGGGVQIHGAGQGDFSDSPPEGQDYPSYSR